MAIVFFLRGVFCLYFEMCLRILISVTQSQDQNAEQNHNINIYDKFFKRVEQFRYLEQP